MPILEQTVREMRLTDRVEVLATTCRNRCDYGPSLNVYPGPVFYNLLNETAIRQIVKTHLDRGSVVEQWLYRPKLDVTRRR